MTSNLLVGFDIPPHIRPECVVDVDIYNMPGSGVDPYTSFLSLRKEGRPDFLWTPRNGGHWIATKGADILEICSDYARFSNKHPTAPKEVGDAMNLIPLQVDMPMHKHYRQPITRSMSAATIQGLEEGITALTREIIDGFRARGECDFMTEFAEVLPVEIFLMFCGLPRSDGASLRQVAQHLGRPDGTVTPVQFITALDNYLLPHVQGRLNNPGTDLLSQILSKGVNGRPWTLEEALRMSRDMLIAGLDTIVSTLGFIAHFLALNPAYQNALRKDPETIERAADELLRRFPVVTFAREVVNDVTINGTLLKAGELVLLPTMLHNLDERIYEDPLKVDFKRGLVAHVTFGHGIHRCAGAGLAKLETIIFLREWMARLPEFHLSSSKPTVLHGGTILSPVALPLIWNARD